MSNLKQEIRQRVYRASVNFETHQSEQEFTEEILDQLQTLFESQMRGFAERVNRIILSGEFAGANPDKSKWMNELVSKMWQDILQKALEEELKGGKDE